MQKRIWEVHASDGASAEVRSVDGQAQLLLNGAVVSSAAIEAPRYGRVVKNMIDGAAANFNAGWTEVATNGTTDVSGVTTAAFTSSSTTCRLGRYRDFSFVAGRKYAVSATLSGVTGTFDHSLSTSCAQVGGGVAKNVVTGNGRTGFVFTAAETAVRVVRVGINPEASAACTNGATVTVSNLLVEEIPSYQGVPSDYVPTLVSGEYDFESGNTISSGIITSATGVKRTVTRGRMCLVVGDSLANDATDFGQIWYRTRGATQTDSLPINIHATASTTMAQALAEWDTVIAASRNIVVTQNPTLTNSLPANSFNTAVYVWERGINDILLTPLSFAQMQAQYEDLLSKVQAIGAKVLIFSPTPCKGYSNNSDAKILVMHQLMEWLPTRCAQTNYAVYFDRYSLLEDPARPDYLNPIYDLNYPNTPDYLHTNAAGGGLIAAAVDAKVKTMF